MCALKPRRQAGGGGSKVRRKPCSYRNVTLSMLVEWDDLEGFLSVYHDAILRGCCIPVEMVRARLTHQERTRDHRAQ